jgi:single-strand DNA-binding protein
MSTLKNKVQLIGNAGQDPSITTLENGKVVAQFSMATNERFKNAKGKKQSETDWHSVVAWGKVALIVEKYVGKGDQIAVEGKLKQRSYKTESGEKRHYTEIVANEVLFLGSKNDTIITEK